jgi:hypothetical protein
MGFDSSDLFALQNLQAKIDASVPLTTIANPLVYKNQDTYTSSSSSGTIIDASATSAKYFSINVKGSPVAAGTWNVVLEGSHDGIYFTTILVHNTGGLDNRILFSGGSAFPCLYFRSRCENLVLGSANSIAVDIIGTS